jgi:8-oxo-dGTP diphosphatase
MISETDYLNNYDVHDHPVPLTTVDVCIFSIQHQRLKVLVTKRRDHPFKGCWALPGGFIDLQRDHALIDSARRKLEEKTGVASPYLEQVISVGNKFRDPRGWSVTVVYMALLPFSAVMDQITDQSSSVDWHPVGRGWNERDLAFDHIDLIARCLNRLRNKAEYTALPLYLLDAEFTLGELQRVYEIVLDSELEKKSFRRRILDAGLVHKTGKLHRGGNRPAMLYRVNDRKREFQFERIMRGNR